MTSCGRADRREAGGDAYTWVDDIGAVDWSELSELYRLAPLGQKPPDALMTVFANSRFACFVYIADSLVGAASSLMDSTVPTSPTWRCIPTTSVEVLAERSSGVLSRSPPGTTRSSCTPTQGRRPSTGCWGSCR